MLGDVAPPLIRGFSAGWSKYYLKLHEIVYGEASSGRKHRIEVKAGAEKQQISLGLVSPLRYLGDQ
jgi:hypothetical protein